MSLVLQYLIQHVLQYCMQHVLQHDTYSTVSYTACSAVLYSACPAACHLFFSILCSMYCSLSLVLQHVLQHILQYSSVVPPLQPCTTRSTLCGTQYVLHNITGWSYKPDARKQMACPSKTEVIPKETARQTLSDTLTIFAPLGALHGHTNIQQWWFTNSQMQAGASTVEVGRTQQRAVLERNGLRSPWPTVV
jgi:hypothetical protein